MKKRTVIILSVYFILTISCKIEKNPIDKNINYEELALKYFNDSIYRSEKFNLNGEKMFFDGLVTGCSKYYYSPFEAHHTSQYRLAVEFKKSNLNNKVKDFYINVPDKIQKTSFEEFKNIKNNRNYFLNVKHYIKSKKRILVEIDCSKQKEFTNKIYIFLQLDGSFKEWEEEIPIFIAPPKK